MPPEAVDRSRATLLPKVFAHELLASHEATFRFILWQKQFRLISDDSQTWTPTWQMFFETYVALINANELEDFVVSSSDMADEVLQRAVHVDVVRLCRYFKLFAEDEGEIERHVKRLERILYLFAQYNAADGYNQGYHEILAVLYYVSIQGGGQLGLDSVHCEAVAYFLLHALINGTVIGDIFLVQQKSSVLLDLCASTEKLLSVYDRQLGESLAQNQIEPLLFAIGWFKVLFALMYPIEFLLPLWDLLFARIDDLSGTLVSLVVAHLTSIRKRLIGSDFVSSMVQLSRLYVGTGAHFAEILHHFRSVQRIRQI
jgi:hypothetical protein